MIINNSFPIYYIFITIDKRTGMWYLWTLWEVRNVHKKIIAFLLAALVALLSCTGCGNLTVENVMNVIAPEETPPPGSDITFSGIQEQEIEPLEFFYSDLDGILCPFWAEKDGDALVAELTQLKLVGEDKNASPAEWFQKKNEDGSTEVVFRLKDGVAFSDGHPVTAKDIVFSYYVLLDGEYDGPFKLNTLPIRGLSAYWNGMDMDMYGKYIMMYDQLYNGGRYDQDLQDALDAAKNDARERHVSEANLNRDAKVAAAQKELDEYDYVKAQEIQDAIEAAWKDDASALVKYTIDNYSGSISLRTRYTKEQVLENYGLQVVYTMLDRGYGAFNEEGGFTSGNDLSWDLVTGFPTIEDLFSVMYKTYNGDPEQYWSIEGFGRPDMLSAVENRLVRQWAPEDEYWRGSIDSISGISMQDEKTVSVTLEYCDDTVLGLLMDIYVIPLHFYGSEDLFDMDSGLFGFQPGNLNSVKALDQTSLGAGEFVYREMDVRSVYLDPNPFYWLGKSAVPYVVINKQ